MSGLTSRSAAHLRRQCEEAMKVARAEFMERQTHYVYRCYDAAGHLLYVGCTEDVNARMNVHASSWNNPASAVLNMRMARYEVEEYPTKSAARAAEREAIYNEAPLCNLHHQRERISPTERRKRLDSYLEATRPPANPDFAAALSRWIA